MGLSRWSAASVQNIFKLSLQVGRYRDVGTRAVKKNYTVAWVRVLTLKRACITVQTYFSGGISEDFHNSRVFVDS